MRCVVTDALFPPLSLSLSLSHVTNVFLFVVVSFHHHPPSTQHPSTFHSQQPASCDTHPRHSTQRYRMSHYRMARIELRQCFIG